jgi:hypothetical protein
MKVEICEEVRSAISASDAHFPHFCANGEMQQNKLATTLQIWTSPPPHHAHLSTHPPNSTIFFQQSCIHNLLNT